MHCLLITLFIATSIAAPQYNYQQGLVSSNGFPSSVQSFTGTSGLTGSPAVNSLAGTSSTSNFAGTPAASVGNFAASSGPTIVNKQFFIHSAPEEAFDEASSSNQEQSQLSRYLRVVIVKAPENKALENAAVQLARSASEDKTAIYILNKQTDLGQLQSKLSQISETHANKPEVHFVKYKTPEEAQYAQQSIQNQYNNLPGPTQVSDEGIAPVESYEGIGSGTNGFGGNTGGFGTNVIGGLGGNNGGLAGGSTASNQYLPPQRV